MWQRVLFVCSIGCLYATCTSTRSNDTNEWHNTDKQEQRDHPLSAPRFQFSILDFPVELQLNILSNMDSLQDICHVQQTSKEMAMKSIVATGFNMSEYDSTQDVLLRAVEGSLSEQAFHQLVKSVMHPPFYHHDACHVKTHLWIQVMVKAGLLCELEHFIITHSHVCSFLLEDVEQAVRQVRSQDALLWYLKLLKRYCTTQSFLVQERPESDFEVLVMDSWSTVMGLALLENLPLVHDVVSSEMKYSIDYNRMLYYAVQGNNITYIQSYLIACIKRYSPYQNVMAEENPTWSWVATSIAQCRVCRQEEFNIVFHYYYTRSPYALPLVISELPEHFLEEACAHGNTDMVMRFFERFPDYSYTTDHLIVAIQSNEASLVEYLLSKSPHILNLELLFSVMDEYLGVDLFVAYQLLLDQRLQEQQQQQGRLTAQQSQQVLEKLAGNYVCGTPATMALLRVLILEYHGQPSESLLMMAVRHLNICPRKEALLVLEFLLNQVNMVPSKKLMHKTMASGWLNAVKLVYSAMQRHHIPFTFHISDLMPKVMQDRYTFKRPSAQEEGLFEFVLNQVRLRHPKDTSPTHLLEQPLNNMFLPSRKRRKWNPTALEQSYENIEEGMNVYECYGRYITTQYHVYPSMSIIERFGESHSWIIPPNMASEIQDRKRRYINL